MKKYADFTLLILFAYTIFTYERKAINILDLSFVKKIRSLKFIINDIILIRTSKPQELFIINISFFQGKMKKKSIVEN